ncbi:MAG TPA: TIGR03557 family F420-dependent LLM class oxidoreductase [Egibacteraceae bacterium]|nr:TIGR03557 family F420-dependent LLM class oxidoreductase [Actinomycetota bacterium]HWB72816.1 TIGR03557 family F420-dependent LLM class oxidoreductase [Egibacteraceae bacterium]
MVKFGYTLLSELHGPKELVDQAQAAEDAGFDLAVISDHFHPWLDSHSDSPFAWSVLGAVAERTQRLQLATLVTCPTIRYHPAIIAQAAATVAILSDGRFTLGVGAGENLNEHVVGHGWPPVDVRHEMLEEAVEAMRLLWRGDYCSFRGKHVTVVDARLYTVPDQPPPVAVAASSSESLKLAARIGDALVGVEPDPDLVSGFERAGGLGKRKIGQVPLSYDVDEAEARRLAMRFKFAVPGWKVMAELPNPVSFEAATATVREDDVAGIVACGPDPDAHVAAISDFVAAGFEEVCLLQVGDDHEGFLRFWRDELAPRLR